MISKHKRYVKIELTAELRGITPKIWRRLRVRGNFRLDELHVVLQAAFGWEDCHLHEFRDAKGRVFAPWDDDGDRKVIDTEHTMTRTILGDVGDEALYRYDFGDNWEVDLRVTAVDEKVEPPAILEGARAGPPEDCGGVPGYVELLAALADPNHKRHKERREWSDGFAPEAFDLNALNHELRRQLKHRL